MVSAKKEVLAVMLLVLCVVFFAGLSAQHQICDDACISLRYARNIAENHGSVSQIGSSPVEGYSNWALVHLVACWGRLLNFSDWTGYIVSVNLINLISILLSSVLVFFWSRKDNISYRFSLFSSVLVSSSWVVHSYKVKGLESCQNMFVVTLFAFSLYLGLSLPILLSAILVFLSRPEGLFISAPIILFWMCDGLIYRFQKKERALNLSDARIQTFSGKRVFLNRLKYSLLFFLCVALHLGWRIYRFGNILPNTVRAKVFSTNRGFSEGIGYLKDGLLNWPLCFLGLLFWFGWFVTCPQKANKYRVFLLVCLQFLFVLQAGGDDPWFGQWRFLIPLFPITILSIGHILHCIDLNLAKLNAPKNKYFRLPRRISSVFLVLLLVTLIITPTYSTWSKAFELNWVDNYLAGIHWKRILLPKPWDEYFLGETLARVIPDTSDISIVNGQAGAFFMSFRNVVHRDPCGLVDKEVALTAPDQRMLTILQSHPSVWIGFEERIFSPEGWNCSESFRTPTGYSLQIIAEIVWNYRWYGELYHVQSIVFPVFIRDELEFDFSKIDNRTTFYRGVLDGDGVVGQIPYLRFYSDLN